MSRLVSILRGLCGQRNPLRRILSRHQFVSAVCTAASLPVRAPRPAPRVFTWRCRALVSAALLGFVNCVQYLMAAGLGRASVTIWLQRRNTLLDTRLNRACPDLKPASWPQPVGGAVVLQSDRSVLLWHSDQSDGDVPQTYWHGLPKHTGIDLLIHSCDTMQRLLASIPPSVRRALLHPAGLASSTEPTLQRLDGSSAVIRRALSLAAEPYQVLHCSVCRFL